MKPFSTPTERQCAACKLYNSTGGARAMSYHEVRMNTPSLVRSVCRSVCLPVHPGLCMDLTKLAEAVRCRAASGLI